MSGAHTLPNRRINLRAAALTTAAVALFAVSDAVIKLLTATYPPGQILFCRGVLASLIAMPSLFRQFRNFKQGFDDAHAEIQKGQEVIMAEPTLHLTAARRSVSMASGP